MENASKALIMIGGILIALIVISVGVYIFNMFSKGTEPYNQKVLKQEIWAFNNKFFDCMHYNKETGDYEATIQDVVTIINLAIATENQEITVLVNFDSTDYGCNLNGEVYGKNIDLMGMLKSDNNQDNKKIYKINKNTGIEYYTSEDSNPYIVGAIKKITITDTE